MAVRGIIVAVRGTVITSFLDLEHRKARAYGFGDVLPPKQTFGAITWEFDTVLDPSLC
jgi:hypothetical protein